MFTKYLCATVHSLTKYCYNQSLKGRLCPHVFQANLTPEKSKIIYNINKSTLIQLIVPNRIELQNFYMESFLRKYLM